MKPSKIHLAPPPAIRTRLVHQFGGATDPVVLVSPDHHAAAALVAADRGLLGFLVRTAGFAVLLVVLVLAVVAAGVLVAGVGH